MFESVVKILEIKKITSLVTPILKENRKPTGLEYLAFNSMKSNFAQKMIIKASYTLEVYKVLYANKTLDDIIEAIKNSEN